MTNIIAEIGQNYNGSIEKALKLIELAKLSGADIAKFQIFDPKTIFQKTNNPWWKYNLANELKKDDVFRLFEECNKHKIEFMASVFDLERLQWLIDLDVKKIKIASRSIDNKELINKAIETGKEIVISLGQWTGKSLPYGQKDNLKYLYCVSNYPTELVDLNLRNVNFNRIHGFSDHSIGTTAALFAMSMGARIIEKHFTDDKKSYGPDHSCSATPDELKILCDFRDNLKILR